MKISNNISLVDTYFRINPKRFHYIKFILEGYDNLAVISSVKNHHGVIRMKCARESLTELMNLLSTLVTAIKQPTLL